MSAIEPAASADELWLTIQHLDADAFGWLFARKLEQLAEREPAACQYFAARMLRSALQGSSLLRAVTELKARLAANEVNEAVEIVRSIENWLSVIECLASETTAGVM